MDKLDNYFDLCAQVYELSKPSPPSDAYAFYRDYVQKAQGLVLEPMCGTGRFLLPLLEEGFEVEGFDASDAMLEILASKAKAKNLKPQVWKGFAQGLQRKERYNLIFIPSGSFCLLIDFEVVRAVLKAFYEHLNVGGVLLFEIETINAIPPTGIWQGSVWPKADNQMILLSQLTTFKDDICSTFNKYELVSNNHITQVELENLKVRIYNKETLIALLESCGFKHIRTLKAFDNEALPDQDDESMVIECHKI